MKSVVYILILAIAVSTSLSRIIEVGTGKQHTRLQAAATVAQPGDTILIEPGIYTGGDFIQNMAGTNSQWITITAAQAGTVNFRGNTQAFHLSDVSYTQIENLTFEQQTSNGVNIDDAATFDTPTHHIRINNCHWKSMNATGNNDELKLSGLDDFEITNCTFTNGSTGGSLIDMVGCHRGLFKNNYFQNGGSNAIQAKGGTSQIFIHANTFINCGERAINIGGSTGLQFFRPLTANYEAKEIRVASNTFIGSTTPIAFVGAVDCIVENNTIYKPSRWALRILQETTAQGFLPCSNNIVRNNIIVLGNTGTVAINIGANTAPETFTFQNNLWYNPDNQNWSGPNTPVTEQNQILNRNPQLTDTISFRITPQSPAYKAGIAHTQPLTDKYGIPFASPPSIGAVEVATTSVPDEENHTITVVPQPATSHIVFQATTAISTIQITSLQGLLMHTQECNSKQVPIQLAHYPSGIYFAHITCIDGTRQTKTIHIIH